MKRYVYNNAASSLLHHKSGEDAEKLILPVTMYANVLNAPHYTDNIVTYYGAEFLLFKNKTLELTDDTYNRMLNYKNIDY